MPQKPKARAETCHELFRLWPSPSDLESNTCSSHKAYTLAGRSRRPGRGGGLFALAAKLQTKAGIASSRVLVGTVPRLKNGQELV